MTWCHCSNKKEYRHGGAWLIGGKSKGHDMGLTCRLLWPTSIAWPCNGLVHGCLDKEDNMDVPWVPRHGTKGRLGQGVWHGLPCNNDGLDMTLKLTWWKKGYWAKLKGWLYGTHLEKTPLATNTSSTKEHQVKALLIWAMWNMNRHLRLKRCARLGGFESCITITLFKQLKPAIKRLLQ